MFPERICEMCNQDVETTTHFLYDCDRLTDIRERYKEQLDLDKNHPENLYNKPFVCGKYVDELWNKRQEILFVGRL